MKQVLIIFLILSLMAPIFSAYAENSYDLSFSQRDLDYSANSSDATTITGTGSDAVITGNGARILDGAVSITRKGEYVLTGSFINLPIRISVGESDKVQLILSGAEITCTNGPAIFIQSADKVFITAAEGTVNSIADGTSYEAFDGETALDAAVFSRADLCVNGKGSLTVSGQYKHGIVSKDDLIIAGLVLQIASASTALDGKDCVKIADASVTLQAGTNGIRSDNNEDDNRGFVYLQNSTFVITAEGDGVQAARLLQADNCVMTLTTGGGSSSTVGQSTYGSRSTDDSWGGRSSGGSRSQQSNTNAGSWKGLKAGESLILQGGAYMIDAADDCLHSNADLSITDGSFTLSSADDGIHADNELHISGGSIIISRSYEGIEASKLVISGGTIDITASDDGLNAAGGADGSASADRWGRGMFSNGVGEIEITGGYTHINASGDGIDSNNNILVSGGITLVSGSSNSANAAFDYDGEATVTGGILFAAGGSGMAQSFTDAQNQSAVLFGLSGATGGVNLAIVDEAGQVIASFTPENQYSAVVITAPGLQLGNTYSVVAGAEISGTDSHGFAQGAAYSGGQVLGEIEITSLLQGGSGHSTPGGGGRNKGW